MRWMGWVALVLALAGAARGDEDVEQEVARAHFRTGQAYYKNGRYAEAAREFEEAFRLFGRSEILYDVAKSHDGAGDFVRARAAYRRYLVAEPNSAEREGIEVRIKELSQHVATVTLRAKVAGAIVRLDGQPVGATPLAEPLELNPGRRRLEVVREGHATWTRELDVIGGAGALTLDVDLVELAPITWPSRRKPIYKQWWLWTAVGVVVAGAVVGGVLGTRSSGGNEIVSTLPVVR
jgi:tetratricopeptide (TPR) repeat protein